MTLSNLTAMGPLQPHHAAHRSPSGTRFTYTTYQKMAALPNTASPPDTTARLVISGTVP
jgi:hypothetical protein